MRGENFVQLLRRGVERKTGVPNKPLSFFLQNPAPHIEVVENLRAGFAQIVQQIKIEIARARLSERGFKLLYRILPSFAVEPGGVFGRKKKSFSRHALNQSLPYRILAARISKSGIEIIEARIEKHINHRFYLLDVDDAVFLRQSHKSEAELFHIVENVSHNFSSRAPPARRLFCILAAKSHFVNLATKFPANNAHKPTKEFKRVTSD